VMIAQALAADESEPSTVSLRETGVRNLARALSLAEVHALRKALLGEDPNGAAVALVPRDVIVAYVCVGRPTVPAAACGTDRGTVAGRALAVVDHANLTWRSPLSGPNDARLGPRFPVMSGVYAPERVSDGLAWLPSMVVIEGVVAGVSDDVCPTEFEKRVVVAHGFGAISSELVPVAILAAHLGLRVAAAVIVVDSKEGDRA
jgi:hypothetical protein